MWKCCLGHVVSSMGLGKTTSVEEGRRERNTSSNQCLLISVPQKTLLRCNDCQDLSESQRGALRGERAGNAFNMAPGCPRLAEGHGCKCSGWCHLWLFTRPVAEENETTQGCSPRIVHLVNRSSLGQEWIPFPTRICQSWPWWMERGIWVLWAQTWCTYMAFLWGAGFTCSATLPGGVSGRSQNTLSLSQPVFKKQPETSVSRTW